ncbi:MAG: hypothetical protein H0T79_08295 [Deltaproteobacteria bacterium]|nr:hypothetical protein [Deltaproteobacteria bacterium]
MITIACGYLHRCRQGSVIARDLPILEDPERRAVPDGMRVYDAHVHRFPIGVFDAIWRWFDAHAWAIRYRLHAEQVVEFLLARGVSRFTALVYSHKPGMARSLCAAEQIGRACARRGRAQRAAVGQRSSPVRHLNVR